MSTGQTGFGKEFVEEVVLSAELIDRLRNSSSLLGKAVMRSMTSRKQDFQFVVLRFVWLELLKMQMLQL